MKRVGGIVLQALGLLIIFVLAVSVFAGVDLDFDRCAVLLILAGLLYWAGIRLRTPTS